jgi:formate hydrogenlyase subunit 3/multisubunit Na+/H+ antiporter MnhD subunit
MSNKEIQQLGKELGVSQKDVARIQRERLKRKLFYSVLGVIIVACSSGLGFLAGRAEARGSYPFAGFGSGLVAGPKREKGVFILVTVLLSVIGFVAAYKAGHHYYRASTLYDVFSR